jgi:hypothetical protein
LCDNPFMRAHSFILAISLAALLLTACGGVTDPSKNQVEIFSGSVGLLAYGPVHVFNVSKTGELSVRVTSLTPTAAAVIGLIYGQPSGGSCAPLTSANLVGLNRDVFQGQIQKGSWCIQPYDSGFLTAPTNYTLQISHP